MSLLSPGPAFTTGSETPLSVPEQAVVHRSEVTGVYVGDDQGRISLRHVRLGHALPDGRIEVLSGLSEGERVGLIGKNGTGKTTTIGKLAVTLAIVAAVAIAKAGPPAASAPPPSPR